MMNSDPSIMLQETPDFWMTPDRRGAAARATVIIPCYCGEATLLRATTSALSQSLRDIELIIVDDASTDGSWRTIVDILPRDRRIRALRNKLNSGKSVSMNRAIGVARGQWIAVLDADDWYGPERLSSLIAMAERRGADMAADNQLLYDMSARRIAGSAWPGGLADWPLTFDDFLAGSHAYETFNLGMLKPVISMDFVRRSGLAYEVQARHGQDFFYLLQFFLHGGKAAVSDTPLYYYTQPFGTISRQWSHRSRKRYNFEIAYTVNHDYMDAAARAMTPAQLRAFATRTQRLRTLEHYHAAKDLLQSGQGLTAMSLAVRHPRIAGYVFHRLMAKALRGRMRSAVEKVSARCRSRDTGANTAPPHAFEARCAD